MQCVVPLVVELAVSERRGLDGDVDSPEQSAYRSQESAADALWVFALELEHALSSKART